MTHYTTLVQRCRSTNSLLADEIDGEFRRLERATERLRTALEELTGACEVEFQSDQTDDEPDDEPVGSGRNEDGTPDHMLITFGMIRRARAALTP